jgi:hypothetical protein
MKYAKRARLATKMYVQYIAGANVARDKAVRKNLLKIKIILNLAGNPFNLFYSANMSGFI